MSLFRILWLRRFMRRYTNPIPVDKATLWTQRLSILYGVLAWHAFGGVCYMMYTGKRDWALYYGVKSEQDAKTPAAVSFANMLKIPNAQVMRFSGLNKLEGYEIEDYKVVGRGEVEDDEEF